MGLGDFLDPRKAYKKVEEKVGGTAAAALVAGPLVADPITGGHVAGAVGGMGMPFTEESRTSIITNPGYSVNKALGLPDPIADYKEVGKALEAGVKGEDMMDTFAPDVPAAAKAPAAPAAPVTPSEAVAATGSGTAAATLGTAYKPTTYGSDLGAYGGKRKRLLGEA